MNTCLNCSINTNNPKFCSRSCAAIFNNKKRNRFRKTKICKLCNNLIDNKHVYCFHCRESLKKNFETTTVNELEKRYEGSNKYATIREKARRQYKIEIKNGCLVCGYNKHVEVCHIKFIKDFNKESTIQSINAKNNILILCPNCHWEFDHGLLLLDSINLLP